MTLHSYPTIPFLRRVSRLAAGALLLAGFASGALAETADRSKPMNIESDAMRYDDLKQTSVFTGNVLVTKGTIIIRGARLDVRQDAEGYQYGVVTAAPGKRAYYKQKRNAPDEWIEGESEVIEYDSRADNVKFIRNATMRRLLGATPNDESQGALIVYDQSNDTYTVNGSTVPPNTAVNASAPGGRVRTILTPKAATAPAAGASAPAAGAKAPPPAPTPAPGKGLRQSTTLGSDQGDTRK
ncbi:lipopolysaccharide transport periplasmic protein LptA [Variovorax sp. NFACC27]|uniref:lipopolysaccharide transport periplasmic protein LptA n=1 Tax=unclassified Variovorax TaxID=663243 RepID=UPI00089B50B3|nr:lipopolysaccharide export system protein LptA [Variovorax sp. NFACC28]SEG51946.1 lipopolysaccharide export system protein LptA [Variovorax sp. NFACC29]SFC18429.1 lipopolysaccharide export system protein LptA [Variovorax sp. NFACC26]SFH00566.1 lipopolysaccharide export system protein LptA [Variovorax sp. NFACC27]